MTRPVFLNDQIWCPRGNRYSCYLKIRNAAKLVDLSYRTIYRYVEEGKAHRIKVANTATRVRSNCLLKQAD